MMRILFLGQKPIGERCFDFLLNQHGRKLNIAGACSNVSLGVWWKSNGIWKKSQSQSIPFVDNVSRNEDRLLELIHGQKIECLISVQHAWILSEKLLSALGGFAFNLHCAPLPEYMGYNACNHAILNGEKHFAATLHWMIPSVDQGDIAYKNELIVAPDETAHSLYVKTMDAGFDCFQKLVDALVIDDKIPRIPPTGKIQFYKRDSIDGLRQIRDLTNPQEIDRIARAFWFPPFEPAWTIHNGHKYHLVPAWENVD